MGASTLQISPLGIGETLDHYRIEKVVAVSGMSTIYRAMDLTNQRVVAIKIPHFEMESDSVFFDRFQREEAIGVNLSHPGVIKVYPEPQRSRLYLVMEWVEGRLLRQVLNEERLLAPDRAEGIALQICDALNYIHGQGVVHRDLKPENIMLDAAHRAKLIDFGIAAKAGARRLTWGKFSHTQGTPEYISPEQVAGKRGDARSDIYSLGAILYEMLVGEPPFAGSDHFVILNAKTRSDSPSLRKLLPEISPALETIVARTLERDPLHRYQTAHELGWDLNHQNEIVIDRTERQKPRGKRFERKGSVFSYLLLSLLPLAILALLLYVAGHF